MLDYFCVCVIQLLEPYMVKNSKGYISLLRRVKVELTVQWHPVVALYHPY